MDTILILERLDRLEKLLIGSKEVLTFDEASDYTGISRSYLYKLTASGKIPHSKPNGKMVFFDKKKLVDWLLQHKREPQLKLKDNTQSGNLANKNA
ncbi:MAG: excisionase [Flavobacteriales bacterium 32-35-8]|nr:MAG: excisionase [Flavobacteriales bacterium 32-35-8]